MVRKSPFIIALENNDTELLGKLQDLHGLVLRDAALPKRVKILMMMLVDAILNHETGVAVLADQAREAGASEAEVRETVQVAYLMGGQPGLVAATRAFKS